MITVDEIIIGLHMRGFSMQKDSNMNPVFISPFFPLNNNHNHDMFFIFISLKDRIIRIIDYFYQTSTASFSIDIMTRVPDSLTKEGFILEMKQMEIEYMLNKL